MALARKVVITDAWLLNLLSFLFWSAMYLHTAFNWPDKKPEWSSRMITLLHGSIATIVGLSQCDIMNLTFWRLNMHVSKRHYALMVWSWGYFAFDLLWCVAYQPRGFLVICHHASALVAISLYMRKEYTGCTFACHMALMEVTNPLLQTRWFLRYEGYGKSTIFFLVEAAYVVGFITVRGVLGSYIAYKILISDMFDLDEKIISMVFFFVSLGLLYQVVRYVVRRYKPRRSRGYVGQQGMFPHQMYPQCIQLSLRSNVNAITF